MTDASDNFNRANGGLGASWTTAFGSPVINTNKMAVSGGAATDSVAYWNADSFAADQYSQAVVGNLSNALNYAEVVVRFSGGTGYGVVTDGVTGAGHTEFGRWASGNYFTLGGIATTFANGDILKVEVIGTTITCYKNGVSVGSITDSNVSSGQPGAGAFGAATVDDWAGHSSSATDTAIVVDSASAVGQGQNVDMQISMAVDNGQATGEGQNVDLLFSAALVLPVDFAQLVLEGQEIPFILSTPYDDGMMVGQGQDIQLLALSLLTVDAGQAVGEGQNVNLNFGGDTSIVVDSAQMVLMNQNIILAATGLLGNVENIKQSCVTTIRRKIGTTLIDITGEN